MITRRLAVIIASIVCLLGCFVAGQRVSARQAVLVPAPDQLRFQLIGNEPIASPDGRSIVAGWTVLVFKDRRSAQCYVAFERGPSISALEAATCPQ